MSRLPRDLRPDGRRGAMGVLLRHHRGRVLSPLKQVTEPRGWVISGDNPGIHRILRNTGRPKDLEGLEALGGSTSMAKANDYRTNAAETMELAQRATTTKK